MSLVRLLTAGKSLVGIQDSRSRYRSVDPRAMPKFGSEKKANVARESEAKASVEKPKIEKANVENPKVQKMPVAVAREARGNGWVSLWGSKLSSLVSQKPKPARSANRQLNGVPVQGELSLDNIKVVRNDLSDTDLEVVAGKMAPADKVEVKQPVCPMREAPRVVEEPGAFGQSICGDSRPSLGAVLEAVKS